MSQQHITSKQIAQELGIAPSTARVWAKKFKIPRQQRKGVSVYTADALEALKTIKTMRDKGSGYNTIQRVMEPPKEPVTPLQQQDNTPSEAVITAKIEDAITKTLEKSNELAEKYARATFEIGQLTEQVKTLEAQAKLLPSPVTWALHERDLEQLQAENEALKKQLKEEAKQKREAEQLLQVTQAEAQAMRTRGFFARLFNLK